MMSILQERDQYDEHCVSTLDLSSRQLLCYLNSFLFSLDQQKNCDNLDIKIKEQTKYTIAVTIYLANPTQE